MPKVEVNEKLFFNLVGKKYNCDDLFEKKLTHAKAELDEKPNPADPEDQRVIKIELNDTNRPDLWSTGGIARCLREYEGAKHSDYSKFLSSKGNIKDTKDYKIIVDEGLSAGTLAASARVLQWVFTVPTLSSGLFIMLQQTRTRNHS